jgi:hypothetical protein
MIYDVSVTTEHFEYEEYKDVWDQIDDCVKGEKWVKAKRDKYLPIPNATDLSRENAVRYNQYLFRALYMNATGRTLSALVGAVFSKPTKIELPTNLDYLLTNADGNGLGLDQHARGSVEENVKKGRHGLLVDYPATDGPVTLSQRQQGEIRPYIIRYEAQDIINWRVKKVGAVNKICLVVLRERNENQDEFYNTDLYDNYRVLWLDNEGHYNVATMNLKTDKYGKTEIDEGQDFKPRDANGQFLTEIPFKFVGSKDNDYTIDEPPMYDLSNVNLSHYRNSADNEESSFIVGQPTLVLSTEQSSQELLENNPCGVSIGSRSAIVLGQGDSSILLQADPNNLPKSNMEQKEGMMVQLGARLATPSQNQTAEATRINYGAETSQLSIIVSNENEAYSDCIRWCSLFEDGNLDPEFIFELNSNFIFESMSAQDLTAWMNGVQQGMFAQDDLLNMMRKSGMLDENRSNEDILDDIETRDPSV